ncbi:MAG: hypothetical protein AAF288_07625 [Planctomycetota bacterium]
MTPEQLHLVLNHLPLIGVLAATPALVVGLFLKKPAVARVGMLTVLVFASTTGLVMGTGEEAEERYESGARMGVLDAESMAWLHEHDERAHLAGKIGYGLIALSAVGLGLSLLKPRTTKWSAAVVLAAAAVSTAGMAWTAEAAGKIRRPEWRGETSLPFKLPVLTDHDGDGQPDAESP